MMLELDLRAAARALFTARPFSAKSTEGDNKRDQGSFPYSW